MENQKGPKVKFVPGYATDQWGQIDRRGLAVEASVAANHGRFDKVILLGGRDKPGLTEWISDIMARDLERRHVPLDKIVTPKSLGLDQIWRPAYDAAGEVGWIGILLQALDLSLDHPFSLSTIWFQTPRYTRMLEKVGANTTIISVPDENLRGSREHRMEQVASLISRVTLDPLCERWKYEQNRQQRFSAFAQIDGDKKPVTAREIWLSER